MTLKDIQTTIRQCLGIAEFNAMQIAVSKSEASRLILLSPTGTGKTVAFTTAVLRRMDDRQPDSGPKTVIVAPSRELVRQIAEVIRPVATVFGLKTLAIYGGNSFADEEASIKGAIPAIIISTPGRLLDHINRGTLVVDYVRNVVLDEYDKSLELGFHDEMKRISTRLGSKLKTGTPGFVMVTSATKLAEVPSFIDLEKAEIIDFTVENKVKTRLRIINVPSHDRDKLSTLGALIRAISSKGPIIVFVNHRESAERVGEYLTKQHISNVVYHGGLDQQHREMALARFDSRTASVLVATDLAGRGIDVEGVASVIHYHPAVDEQTWTHRNGRTARVDAAGEGYVISGPDDSTPEFVNTDNDYYPDMTSATPVRADMVAIYLDRGKRDKLSRGDIAGFVMKQGGVPSDAVGKISLGANYAIVAVAREYAKNVIEASRTSKVKNVRVRASIL